MDAVAERARERGYAYWRAFTTGKSIGIIRKLYFALATIVCALWRTRSTWSVNRSATWA